MAYSQNFSDHLLRQLNESNRRNLELQSLLAHKDDQLAGANAQLQRALAAPHMNAQPSQPSLVQNLQKRNHDFQGQLQHAKQATTDAQRKLNERTTDFNAVYKEQQTQILALQQKLNLTGIDTKAVVPFEDPAKVVLLEKDLAKANVELKRLRTAYSSLQKQFEAEKKQNEQQQGFPATAPGKIAQTHEDDEDMDDEEPNQPWIKEETSNTSAAKVAPKPSAVSSKKITPSSSAPRQQTVPRSSLYSQSSRRSSTMSNIAVTPRSTISKSSRKTSLASTTQPKSKKRRRSIEEELESELDDLEIFDPIPRKRSRRSIGSNIDVDTSDIRQKFHFKAILDYDSDGGCRYYVSTDKEDIVDECEIWDDIKLVVDSWEEAKGECWAYEFEDKMRGKQCKHIKCCVSSKLRVEGRPKGRTNWRSGCEGKYACKDCVEENKPCFTWDGESEGFKMLPLHEEDRDERYPLKKGYEVRYWINRE